VWRGLEAEDLPGVEFLTDIQGKHSNIGADVDDDITRFDIDAAGTVELLNKYLIIQEFGFMPVYLDDFHAVRQSNAAHDHSLVCSLQIIVTGAPSPSANPASHYAGIVVEYDRDKEPDGQDCCSQLVICQTGVLIGQNAEPKPARP
jgi:hypothetical protein